jgi:hypothetical protein
MRRALRSRVLDLRQLAGALDLWLCMWEPEEQERFETAVVRAMTDANSRNTRMQALALCWALGTARLASAARRLVAAKVFSPAELEAIGAAVSPICALLDAGRALRGNVLAVEQLLARHVAGAGERSADATIDWVDVRDLVAVARTTIDARLFGEIERRIARRGKYQRGRAANLLGFDVRLRTAAHSGPGVESPLFGG